MSATRGASTLGKVWYWVPAMVLLEVMCTYAAPSVKLHRSSVGQRTNCSPSRPVPATLTAPRLWASLIAFLDQVPVLT